MVTRCTQARTGGRRRRKDQVRVNLSYCKYESIRNIVKDLGYAVVEDEDENWDLFWSDLSVSSERVNRMKPFQRMNHFPGMLEICRKGGLSKHIRRMAAHFPKDYSYHPKAFFIPNQLEDFLVALRRNRMKAKSKVDTFIVKPSAGAMGRGIFLAQTEKDVDLSELTTSVAQTYITKPLLLDGFKFDLRIYSLISSVDPLKIYIHKEGIARLATAKYEAPTRNNIRTRNMHLTNYSINKHCDGFVDDEAPDKGTKRLMSSVFEELDEKMDSDSMRIWDEICDLIVMTVLTIQPLLAHTYHSSLGPHCSDSPHLCFELLGFDIMLDSDFKPWLLEVNHSPSFNWDTAVDLRVKSSVLRDTIVSLGLTPFARYKFHEEEKRAMQDRLYKPKTRAKRPLSGMSKQAALRSAAAALEDALTWLPNTREKNSQEEELPRSKDKEDKDPEEEGELLPNGFTQIFPPLTEKKKKKFSAIVETATSLFPTDGCVCGYCRRRQKLAHMTETVQVLNEQAQASRPSYPLHPTRSSANDREASDVKRSPSRRPRPLEFRNDGVGNGAGQSRPGVHRRGTDPEENLPSTSSQAEPFPFPRRSQSMTLSPDRVRSRRLEQPRLHSPSRSSSPPKAVRKPSGRRRGISARNRQPLRPTTYPVAFPDFTKKPNSRRVKSARVWDKASQSKPEQRGESCAGVRSVKKTGKEGRKALDLVLKPTHGRVGGAKADQPRKWSDSTPPPPPRPDCADKRETGSRPLPKRMIVPSEVLDRLCVGFPLQNGSNRQPEGCKQKRTPRESRIASRPSTRGQQILDSVEMKLLWSGRYSSSLPSSYFSAPGTTLRLATKVYGAPKNA